LDPVGTDHGTKCWLHTMTNTTPHPRRIVGIDGSDPSAVALRWAAQRSEDDGVPVVLAHVRAPGAQPDDTPLEAAEAYMLAEHPAVPLERLPLTGPLWHAFSTAAGPDDVIVVGTHKTGLVHGRVTGALPLQIAATAPCAVVVVPDVDLSFRRGVVVGIGQPETAARVASEVSREATRAAVPVTLVHGGCAEHCDDGLDAAEAALVDLDATLTVRRRVLATPAADALLDVARDKELLVLGRGSRSATSGPVGVVTQTVLLNATSPVLILGPSTPARGTLVPVAQ
jgi:nucleotide-binding universal stress UspA family protein